MRVRVLYEDGELVSRGKAESKECTGLYNKAWVAGISWDEVLKAAGIEHPWYMFLVKKTVRMFGYRSFRRKFFKDFKGEIPGLKRVNVNMVLGLMKDDGFIIKWKEGYKLTDKAIDKFSD